MKLNEIQTGDAMIASWIERFVRPDSKVLGDAFFSPGELCERIEHANDGYVLPVTVKNLCLKWSGKFEAPPFILNGVNWLILSSDDCETIDLGFVDNAWVLSFAGNLGNLNHYVSEVGKLQTPLGASHKVMFKAVKPCSGLIETLDKLQHTRVYFGYVPEDSLDTDLKNLGSKGFKITYDRGTYNVGYAGESAKYDNLFDVQDRLVSDGFAEFI